MQLGGPCRGATTTRSRSGGATKTMASRYNPPAVESRDIERRNMARRGGPYFQIQHLIEVAVVQSSIPSDGDGIAAHQARDGLWIERLGQPIHVVLVVAGSQEKLQEPADRHVRDAEEMIELDAELVIEHAAKIGFQRSLWWREECPYRIVNQL